MNEFLENLMMYGEAPELILLTIIVIFDIFLGLGKAWATKSFSSSIMRKGLVSHAATLICLLIAQYSCQLIDAPITSGFLDVFTLFLYASYGCSIIENLKEIGVPIPDWITNRLKDAKEDLNDGKKPK